MLNFLRQHKYIPVSSIFFVILALALIINSGYKQCLEGVCQYYFAEWQMHDSLWHISLAKLAFGSYPFSNPFYAGATLAGYNYFIDLVLYGIQWFGINAVAGYFFFLPILAVFIYLHSTWLYLKDVCSSNFERFLATFFLYFGTSLSYLLTLYTDHSISGATLRGFPVVTSLHPPSMLLNLPYAFSLPIILYTLIYLAKRHRPANIIYLLILVFLAFGLKFYAGVVVVLVVLINSPAKLLVTRIFVVGLASLLAYTLFYRGGTIGIPFAFDPLALVHVVIDDVHLFYNHSLTLARYHLYENITALPLRLIAIEAITVFAFFFINWGTRIIGYIVGLTSKNMGRQTKSMLILSLFLGLIPVLFVQKGGWYNTMQFMYYSTLLLSLATAKVISQLSLTKPRFALVLALLIALPLLPTSLEQLTYYVRPKNVVSTDELKALETLRSMPPGTVHVNRPWAKRALIPVFAEKQMYYLDEDQLMLMLPSHTERLDLVRKYQGGSINQIPADYYVIYKNEVASEDSVRTLNSNPNLLTIYNSDQIIIYAHRGSDVTIN